MAAQVAHPSPVISDVGVSSETHAVLRAALSTSDDTGWLIYAGRRPSANDAQSI